METHSKSLKSKESVLPLHGGKGTWEYGRNNRIRDSEGLWCSAMFLQCSSTSNSVDNKQQASQTATWLRIQELPPSWPFTLTSWTWLHHTHVPNHKREDNDHSYLRGLEKDQMSLNTNCRNDRLCWHRASLFLLVTKISQHAYAILRERIPWEKSTSPGNFRNKHRQESH